MEKVLFYGMTGEKMCFLHVLMNALQLSDTGRDVRIVFEGASVKLVGPLEEEQNPLYLKAKAKGLIAGICLACSKVMGVYDQNAATGLPLLDDMNGHAGMKPFMDLGFVVIPM